MFRPASCSCFPFRFLPALAVALALVVTGTGSRISAQQIDAKLDAHPATRVVKEYLLAALQREWKLSGSMVDDSSLRMLRDDYANRVKSARTMDEEAAMLKRIDKTELTELKDMAPMDFYIAYHKGMQERWQVTDEAAKAVKDSLKLKVLSIAEETPELIHVLVRTSHNNGKAAMENLELISLVKSGNVWKVSLEQQMPKITPINGNQFLAPGDAAKKDATPPPAPPRRDPVKPAPKKTR